MANREIQQFIPALVVENHGSLFLLRPMTDGGRAWLQETAPEDAQFFGDALVVEPRYIAQVVKVAQLDGLVVR